MTEKRETVIASAFYTPSVPMCFRVWDGQRMWYPEDMEDNDVLFLRQQDGKCIAFPNQTEKVFDPAHHEHLIAMESIGRRDTNDREVYQDDIVKCSKGCPHRVVKLLEVPSSHIGGMPGFYLSEMDEGYVWMGSEEVIGNIHENPEWMERM